MVWLEVTATRFSCLGFSSSPDKAACAVAFEGMRATLVAPKVTLGDVFVR